MYTHTRTHRDAAAERNIAVGSAQYEWLAAYIYNIDYIYIIYIICCAERNIAVGSAQYEWLAATLREVDRSVTPWLVVMGHRPGYVDSNLARL